MIYIPFIKKVIGICVFTKNNKVRDSFVVYVVSRYILQSRFRGDAVFNELRNVVQEKRQVVEQISALQQQIRNDEIWLRRNTPATVGYQEVLKELLALQAYVGELHAQAVALDDVLLELTAERDLWDDPGLLLAS